MSTDAWQWLIIALLTLNSGLLNYRMTLTRNNVAKAVRVIEKLARLLGYKPDEVKP
jgi:hypothetical protein